MSSHNKDKIGFERAYHANKELIYRTAMKYSDNNTDVAQEITQDVFLKLYIHFDTFDEEYLTAWLVTTTKNLARNYRKKASREILDEDIILTSDLHIENMVESTEDTVINEFLQKEDVRRGNSILDALYEKSKRWYEAVTMVYCMEKKQADVAEEMGISIEVLHSVLYRAKKWINKEYNSDEHTQ